jgi:hypothetical protein
MMTQCLHLWVALRQASSLVGCAKSRDGSLSFSFELLHFIRMNGGTCGCAATLGAVFGVLSSAPQHMGLAAFKLFLG